MIKTIMILRQRPVSNIYRRFYHIQNKIALNQEKNNEVTSLCKYLRISETKAHYLIMKHPVITKLNEERMKTLMDSLSEIGFTNNVLVKEPSLFGILPITLKFRHKVLTECGIEHVTPKHLATYLTIIRQKTIRELKQLHYIPAHINVENRLAKYMTQWPTSLTTLIYEDVDYSTLFTLRMKIIERYLELVLDLTKEEFQRGVETYPTVKHRPLEYINEVLQILQSQIGIPNHKIKNNLYLIHADPDNLKKILYNIRTIGGIDVREVIRLHPKIAIKNCESLFKIKEVLEEYGISNEAQRRCFDIFTLGPDTIRERLEKAKTTPEFSMFFNHPRFLKMIHYKKTAMKRLSKSYENNKKCLSLNVLSGCSAHYEVFEKTPGDRLGKGKDLLFCISQSFDKKISMAQIRNLLRRHPFWINTPVLQVKFVFEQLSKKFTQEEIYENCQILLYPWKKVREIMSMLEKGQSKNILSLPENFKVADLTNTQKLSMILYLIEKNHYFSGNGVWSEERNKIFEKIQIHQETDNLNV